MLLELTTIQLSIMLTPIKFKKGKSVPLPAWSGPEGSRKLTFPDFITTAQDGGKVVSLTHRPPLPLANTPGTHFCYRLSRLQGHSGTLRIMSLKNSSDTIGNRARDPPLCSLVSLPLCHRAPRKIFIIREKLAGMLSRNVGKQLPCYVAQHSGRLKTTRQNAGRCTLS